MDLAMIPTELGDFHAAAFEADGATHVAMIKGDVRNSADPVLVRVHSKCLTGDTLFSLRCDCGAQLRLAMQKIAAEGKGVLLYLDQEGRGIGLVNKLRAYALQDDGHDTISANEHLGFQADLRDYGIAAKILASLGVTRLRLMTNNPKKVIGLTQHALEVVERIPLVVAPSEHNAGYLRVKRDRLGHLLD